MKAVAAATLALGLFSTAVEGAVFAKAAKFASILASSATSLPTGNYVLQNAGTKKWMAFSRSRGVPDVVGSKNPTIVRLTNLGKRRIVLGLDRYCLSSQWDAKRGINHADTLYRCCVSATKVCDNGSDEGPLRNVKQQHYFVAAKASSIRITSAAVNKRDLTEDSHPVPFEERELLPYNEEQDDIVLDKRASKGKKFAGTYAIIPIDHILDMKTQAVSGQVKVAAGRQISPVLDILNAKDNSQYWHVYKLK